MSDPLKLHELPPSPNCARVRLALGYKRLAYEREILDPRDRSHLVAISGQPRAPVLEHGARVVFDSYAILRYLDANFRRSPRLYSEEHATMGELERWENFARSELAQPVGSVFAQLFAEEPDERELARACDAMTEVSGRLEERLADGPYLLGETLLAADLACAPLVRAACLPSGSSGPLVGFLAEHFRLGAGRDRTRAWVERVFAYDS